MKFNSGAATDTGQVRKGNEDSYVVDPRLQLFAVADGVGGHQGGEVASSTALESLRASIASGVPMGTAVRAANDAVFAKAHADSNLRGMGTTLTAAVPVGNQIIIGHVGDSRAYLLRDGELQRISVDHSLVEELIAEGKITEEQAITHPQRSIITRALGIGDSVAVDEYAVTPAPGDRLLLCSDGLTGMLRDPQISAILRREPDPTRAANALVDAANSAGGEDNITTVIIDIEIGTTDLLPTVGTVVDVPIISEPRDKFVPVQPVIIPPPGDTPAASADDALQPNSRRSARANGSKASRSIWRLGLWAIPTVTIVVIAVCAVWWFARNTYYIGANDRGQVIVYQGRPNGLLGWNPTVARTSELRIRELTEATRLEITENKEFATKGAAIAYLLRLKTNLTSATSTTTGATTTTVPTNTAPTTSLTQPILPLPTA
ncbi:MAG: Stp1/IreP family PP2C-type Ser/Thr phosphatase [Acidimicrobiia bacterium]|nr:Stp1/IreP family PP2C-type Ser/Thr phosphatase [Acidimicrobiia bacterium]